MATKNNTKSSGNGFTRFLISIIFIALGTSSVVGVLQDLLTLDLNIGIAAALGIFPWSQLGAVFMQRYHPPGLGTKMAR